MYLTRDKGLGWKTNFARLCRAFVLALSPSLLPPPLMCGKTWCSFHRIPSTQISSCKAFSSGGMIVWQPCRPGTHCRSECTKPPQPAHGCHQETTSLEADLFWSPTQKPESMFYHSPSPFSVTTHLTEMTRGEKFFFVFALYAYECFASRNI